MDIGRAGITPRPFLVASALRVSAPLLEPGDLVTLTDPHVGLSQFPVRIRSIDEDDTGALAVIAEEFPGAIGTVL